LGFEALESRTLLAVNVLNYHNDTASTGQNLLETDLTPASVSTGGRFGKLFTVPVDGQIYAQPLIDTAVTITTGPNTVAGAAGLHDVVFVATQHDTLYALDASTTGSGAILWKRSFLDASNPNNGVPGTTVIATVPASSLLTQDINPEVGITGTPVIDGATNTLYVITKTQETAGGITHIVQRLHAINLADGTDRVTPYLIGDSTGNGANNNTQIFVYGTGDGASADTYYGTANTVVKFNALRQNQRMALSLVNGQIYASWASHGDNGPYHGWVVKWDVSQLTTTGFKLSGVLNVSPNGAEGGIWQGGGQLAFEANGSAFYFETGNGAGNHAAIQLDANGFPTDASYYDAVIRAAADPTTTAASQNRNGWGIKIVDYFIPYNQSALDAVDADLGSAGPLLLPDSAGIANHPHLLVASGKQGRVYLIDRDNMGKFSPNTDNVINAVPDGAGHNTPPVILAGLLNTPSYYNGKIYIDPGYSDTAKILTINANGMLTVASQSTGTKMGNLSGSISISASGSTNGIAWVMDRATNAIHAYDASSMASELWNSNQAAGSADAVGAVTKFGTPTIANGGVYVGTLNSLVVYGLKPPTAAAPAKPVLSASPLSSTSVSLSWTDPSVSPNLASGYTVEESLDGTNFTPVTTAPAGSLAIAVGGLQPQTTLLIPDSRL